MTKRGRPRTKIWLTVGDNPALYRFASLKDSLEQNLTLISRLIREGQPETIFEYGETERPYGEICWFSVHSADTVHISSFEELASHIKLGTGLNIIKFFGSEQ